MLQVSDMQNHSSGYLPIISTVVGNHFVWKICQNNSTCVFPSLNCFGNLPIYRTESRFYFIILPAGEEYIVLRSDESLVKNLWLRSQTLLQDSHLSHICLSLHFLLLSQRGKNDSFMCECMLRSGRC